MTIAVTCSLFVAIRIIEEVGRLIIGWFKRKWHKTKEYSTPNYKRLIAIVSPELHAKIKAHVLLLNTTITEYILSALSEKLKRDSNG